MIQQQNMECNQTLIIAVGQKKKRWTRGMQDQICVCVFFPLIFLRALISLSQQIYLASNMFQILKIQWCRRHTESCHHGPYVLVQETDNEQSDNSASKGIIFVLKGPVFLRLSLLAPCKFSCFPLVFFTLSSLVGLVREKRAFTIPLSLHFKLSVKF